MIPLYNGPESGEKVKNRENPTPDPWRNYNTSTGRPMYSETWVGLT